MGVTCCNATVWWESAKNLRAKKTEAEWERLETNESLSFSACCHKLRCDDVVNLPEEALPRADSILGMVGKLEAAKPKNRSKKLTGLFITAEYARVWNLVSYRQLTLIAPLNKLVAAVLVCELEMPRRRRVANQAKDAYGQRIFSEEEIRRFCSDTDADRVAMFRVFMALYHMLHPSFCGPLDDHTAGSQSARRVLELVYLPRCKNKGGCAPRLTQTQGRCQVRGLLRGWFLCVKI